MSKLAERSARPLRLRAATTFTVCPRAPPRRPSMAERVSASDVIVTVAALLRILLVVTAVGCAASAVADTSQAAATAAIRPAPQVIHGIAAGVGVLPVAAVVTT